MLKPITILLLSACLPLIFTSCGNEDEPVITSEDLSLVVQLSDNMLAYHDGEEYILNEYSATISTEVINGTLYYLTYSNSTPVLYIMKEGKMERKAFPYVSNKYSQISPHRYILLKGNVYIFASCKRSDGKVICALFKNGKEIHSIDETLVNNGSNKGFYIDKQTGDIYIAGCTGSGHETTVTVWKNGEIVYQHPYISTEIIDYYYYNERYYNIYDITAENGNWFLTMQYDGWGYDGDIFYCVKNGVEQEFSIKSHNVSIYKNIVKDGKLYWIGAYEGHPTLWVDGKIQQQYNEIGNYTDIKFNGNDIYLSGLLFDEYYLQRFPLLTLNGKKLSHPFLEAIKEEVYNVQMAFPY